VIHYSNSLRAESEALPWVSSVTGSWRLITSKFESMGDVTSHKWTLREVRLVK
jgi:hypothetical protein